MTALGSAVLFTACASTPTVSREGFGESRWGMSQASLGFLAATREAGTRACHSRSAVVAAGHPASTEYCFARDRLVQVTATDVDALRSREPFDQRLEILSSRLGHPTAMRPLPGPSPQGTVASIYWCGASFVAETVIIASSIAATCLPRWRGGAITVPPSYSAGYGPRTEAPAAPAWWVDPEALNAFTSSWPSLPRATRSSLYASWETDESRVTLVGVDPEARNGVLVEVWEARSDALQDR